MIFRFDDISANTDFNKLGLMIDFIKPKISQLYLGISNLCHTIVEETDNKERVFPSFFKTACSEKNYYTVNKMLLSEKLALWRYAEKIIFVSHGLVHIDHTLLTREQQEMSILVSKSLIPSNFFIPPFNKFNQDTISICKENNIVLLGLNEVWKNADFNKFDPEVEYWYCHSWRWKIEDFAQWYIL